MIHEFAVEPEVMATWEHFNVLWDDFGVSRGRFLVECPNGWRRQVFELVDQLTPKPVRASAIKSRLGDPILRRAKLVGADGRQWEGNSWREAALRQQSGARPFRAVVLRDGCAGALQAGEFERDAEPWKVVKQRPCPRQTADMRDCVEHLLAHSGELVLVDRNFDPREPRFARPFEAFTSVRSGWKRLELHTALPSGFDAARQEGAYRRALELAVPQRTTLTVCFWPGLEGGERLHPRFVLTERGGVQFDYGLDEGEGPGESTLVTLLENEVFLGLWADYRPGARKFGQARTLQVVGKG